MTSTTPLQARYTQRGPVPQDVIEAVALEVPSLRAGQVLIQVMAAPINPSDVLTLTGDAQVQATYGIDAIKDAVAAAAAGERSGKILLLPNGNTRA